MFTHLLVPLDGSGLAEAVMPAAVYFARALKARVTLIHIIETDAADTVHGDRHLTDPVEAATYLDAVGQRFFPPDVHFEFHVHKEATAHVPRGIVMHESELAPDLVIMSTHGRSGLQGMLFGRIAQQVAASGNLPVLLIRPDRSQEQSDFTCRRVLAPVDGNPAHGSGLEVASGLARALEARLDLLTVVTPPDRLAGPSAVSSRFAPGTSQAVTQIAEADLESFLRQQADRFQHQGVAVHSHLERGDPATVIAATADDSASDLIVLGTHGRSGAAAFWTQSVAARVLARCQRPVLLVPARNPEQWLSLPGEVVA